MLPLSLREAEQAIITAFTGFILSKFLAGIPLSALVISVAPPIWVLTVIATYLFKCSLDLLGEHSEEKLFKTAALLLFIGVIFLIVSVGVFVVPIAYILLAIAFFKVKPKVPPPEVVITTSSFSSAWKL